MERGKACGKFSPIGFIGVRMEIGVDFTRQSFVGAPHLLMGGAVRETEEFIRARSEDNTPHGLEEGAEPFNACYGDKAHLFEFSQASGQAQKSQQGALIPSKTAWMRRELQTQSLIAGTGTKVRTCLSAQSRLHMVAYQCRWMKGGTAP